MKEVLKVIKEFEEKTGNKVVYLTKSGSKLYGTDTPKSDLDIKGVFVPNKLDVLLKKDIPSYTKDTNNTKEKNTNEDIDFTVHSIYNFFNQLEKSDTGAVDVLFSMFREDTIVYEDKRFTDSIKRNYKQFLNKNMKSFIGYALGQTKKFGIKGARYDELDTFVKYIDSFPVRPTKDMKLGEMFESFREEIKENDYKYIKMVMAPINRNSSDEDGEYISVLGKLFLSTVTVDYFQERVMKLYDQFGNRTKTIAGTISKTDFKALSHSLRIAQEVQELLETDFIKFPLSNADELRAIKSGEADVEITIDKVQDVLSAVDELLLSSKLPENSNREIMDVLLINYLETCT